MTNMEHESNAGCILLCSPLFGMESCKKNHRPGARDFVDSRAQRNTILKQGHPSFSFPDNLVIPLSKLSITQSRISETRQTKVSCRACKVTGSFEKRAFDHGLRITYLVP